MKVNEACEAGYQDLPVHQLGIVIVYKKNNAAIGFHDDNETLIDGNSSISTITFGSKRNIEFCNKSIRPRTCQHVVECGNHDLMIMKAGCQSKLVHRVCKGTTSTSGSDDLRVVISFRKLSSNVAVNGDSEVSSDDPEISFDDPTIGNSRVPDSVTAQDQSPQRVTLLVGDSFIVGMDADRLGRRGKKNVVNLSSGGATITDVSTQLDTYFLSNADENTNIEVDKIVVCVGTNDIRNCKENGIRHLKQPLVLLVEQIKNLFPNSKIWFQSLIPLIIQNQFTVHNVHEFNRLLFEVCSFTKIYFLDVFNMFLHFDQYSQTVLRNEFYFINSKNIHLNKVGLGMLARCYIRLIHSNRFNPLGF